MGSGTLTLTGENTYTGGTTLSAGTLQIGNGGTTGSITGNILNNAALAFNHSDDIAFGGVISGTGSMTKFGAGALTLTGDNTYTGLTTISAGTLQIGDGGTTGGVSGNIVNDGALVFNRSDDITYTPVISGSGTLTKLGAGTLTLTGENTYTGLTTISAGTLEIGNGRTTARSSGSVVGDIVNDGALVFNRRDDLTYSDIISGTGSVTQQGDGILLLTAANTYTGPTFISGGTLQINGSVTSDTTVDAGSALAGTGSIFGDVLNHGLITPGTPGSGAGVFGAPDHRRQLRRRRWPTGHSRRLRRLRLPHESTDPQRRRSHRQHRRQARQRRRRGSSHHRQWHPHCRGDQWRHHQRRRLYPLRRLGLHRAVPLLSHPRR